MTEGVARMSIPVLSSTLLQAELIITVFLFSPPPWLIPFGCYICSLASPDSLGLFCFFLCRQSGSLPCLLLVHLSKLPPWIPALKLSLWPVHTGQADLVLVCHGFPVWKRCPFMFLFVWDALLVIIICKKWISEYPGPKAYYKGNWNNDQKAIVMSPRACHH